MRTVSLLPEFMLSDAGMVAVAQVHDQIDSLHSDIENLFLYNIDQLPMSFVRYLAWQYRIEAWQDLETESAQRDAVRNAIELHRKKGTPWAVEHAVSRLGYESVILNEGSGFGTYDGTYTYSGAKQYGADDTWPLFQVCLDLSDHPFDEAVRDRIYRAVNTYKNLRSHLEYLCWPVSITMEALSAPSYPIDRVAFGTNGDPGPVEALENQFDKPVVSVQEEGGVITVAWNLLATEANGMDIREFGLLTDQGDLYIRSVRTQALEKDETLALDGTWTVAVPE